MGLELDDGTALALIILCFAVASFGVLILLIWGISSLTTFIRDTYRRKVWDAAATLLAENPREVENYVAASTMDLVQYYSFERRPEELPPYKRLTELTKDEAIDGMLRWAAECVRLGVEVAALQAERTQLSGEVARLEKLRARYWRRINRMQLQLLNQEWIHAQEKDDGHVHQERSPSSQRGEDEGEQGAAQGEARAPASEEARQEVS